MKHLTLSSRYGNPSVVIEISEVPKFVEGESVTNTTDSTTVCSTLLGGGQQVLLQTAQVTVYRKMIKVTSTYVLMDSADTWYSD